MENTYALDFEYNRSSQPKMNVIAGVIVTPTKESLRFNLTEPNQVISLKELLSQIREDPNHTLVSYAATAEARALLSLDIDPTQFRWVDLYAEFRMLCNSNNKFKYGAFIDKSNNIQFSKPPPLITMENEGGDDNDSHEETPKNLINSVYKLLGVRLDSIEKETMRDLILRENPEEIKQSMSLILDYCESDTEYLRALDIAIQRALTKEGLVNFRKDQYGRGRYSVCTGIIEHIGMPIDVVLLAGIIAATPQILKMHEEQVNEYFPFFVPETQKLDKVFKSGKVHSYKPKPAHKDMGAYQTYIKSLNIPDFPKTETGKFKSDKDTLEVWGYWAGLESLWKYNKMEASLKWFNKSNKNGFFDRMGSDNRVRPFFGVFGTQTGRNAAKAKTFPLAMSSWLRAIVRPPEGHCIIAADYSQQEVYVAAVLSKDDALMAAYNSGDVYLDFAKQANLVPLEATKETHKQIRNLCKSTVLGIQFGMGKAKLQIKLTLDSGAPVTEELTEKLYEAHKTVFFKYWRWVYEVTNKYKDGEPLITSEGWALFKDNQRIPSVRNFLVQSTGAAITRKALCLMTSNLFLKIIASLHDALYFQINTKIHNLESNIHEINFYMKKATQEILNEEKTFIRIDTKIITHDKVWVDEKGEKEWNKLKEFLI